MLTINMNRHHINKKQDPTMSSDDNVHVVLFGEKHLMQPQLLFYHHNLEMVLMNVSAKSQNVATYCTKRTVTTHFICLPTKSVHSN